ncbi:MULTISPECIES: lysophospholipid acyltransferase family protein [Idiomarina]|uniref:lysophospholipid acyltransferase family protein n=1 Tax=Idiomarina TaxID=135575 RepID=UPI000C63F751|nr:MULTISPECIES: lysophospholipid acyltransferase family protein [Idiomarina]MBP57675.1 1-acyl-sn-glycerol-3-phosphate acyltransferase [Idiomarina sp.]|tara:strand:- start:110249 stop:111085 length:837 start_codon:yes stop_codon:yes gene_type:complete
MLLSLWQVINRTWRRFATGLCFAIFGLGGLLLSVTALPLLAILSNGNEQQRQARARRLVQLTFKWFIGVMKWTGVFNFDFKAIEKLRNVRGHVIIANHPCLIDVVALISFVPNPDCVVKSHLWKNPFMRGVIRSTGYLSNDDPEDLVNDCERSLAQGNNLIIFPEGTRTTPGAAVKFQRGAAHLALRTRAKITALRVDCVPVTLIKNEAWYCAPQQKPTLSVHYLGEIDSAVYCNAEKLSIAARQLTRDLQNYYEKVLEDDGKPEARDQSLDYRVAGS